MRMSPLLLILYSLPDARCQLFGVQRLDETAIHAAHEAGVVDDAGLVRGKTQRIVKPLDAKKLAKSIREAVQNKQ